MRRGCQTKFIPSYHQQISGADSGWAWSGEPAGQGIFRVGRKQKRIDVARTRHLQDGPERGPCNRIRPR
jgi:hypothetical protein